MDITRFSEPKFEVKSWINEMLSPQKSELQSTNSTFEVQASNLMMKLQLMVQELQNKVQEAGQRVIASVPKAVRDLESLKLEARSLKQELGQIDTQMEIFGKEYSLDIQSLKTLDSIKSRLELSINDLREANNWSVLTQDLDEILYSKDPQQIAQRISNLNRCLQLLKRESNLNVAQTEQVALVEGMQQELRQILAAPLARALAAHNVSETTSLFSLSQDANIPDLLTEVYSRYCVGELEQKWDSLETAEVKTKIQRFFEFLLSFWETELNFCLNTFPSPLEVLCSVLSKSLSTICTAVAALLLALVPLEQPSNISGAQFIELISVKSDIDLFISHFEDSILHIINSSSLPQHYDLESVQSLWNTLHSPLEPYFHKYVQIGTALISEYLSHTCALSHSEGQSLDKITEDFKSSVQSLLSFLSRQQESCSSLSRGLLFNELIQLTDSCCEQYCNLWAERIGSCSLDQGDPSLLGYLFSLLTAVGDFALCLQHKQKEIYSQISTCLKEYINTDCTATTRSDLIPTHSPHRQSLNELYLSVQELRESQSISGMCYLNAISVKNLNNQTGTLLFSSLTYRIAQSLQQSTLQAVYTERGAEVQGEFDPAPSNFITEIGDYLLTLPQLIEPFISGDNPGLFWSLSELEVKPAETDVFQVFSMKRFAHDSFRHILESVLGMVCLFTQEKYLNFVIYLTHLTEHGVSQVSTDIVYFKNILGALEMELLEDLASLHSLLESSPQELQLQLKESRFPDHFIRILIELSSS